MPMNLLSFTVRPAVSAQDLRDVGLVRASAYGHHAPELGLRLGQPEAHDSAPGTVVLLARDKTSGQALGTARVQRHHPLPLQIERCVPLPQTLLDAPRAEITRLAVRPGADHQVRLVLMKACWLWALASQVRHLVISARSAALIRIYQGLGFEDVFGPDDYWPLPHVGGVPHRVLAFDVSSAERVWHARQHGLYPFMVQTWHPDLQLLPADDGLATQPAVPAALPAAAPAVEPAWPLAA